MKTRVPFLPLLALSVIPLRAELPTCVDITAKAETKNYFEGFIKSELRSLKDVAVTEVNPDFKLQLAIFEIETVGGHKKGFALSYAFSRIVKNTPRQLVKGTGYIADLNQLAGDTFPRKELILSSGVRVLGEDDVQAACEQLVADFDSQTLQYARASPGQHNERQAGVLRQLGDVAKVGAAISKSSDVRPSGQE